MKYPKILACTALFWMNLATARAELPARKVLTLAAAKKIAQAAGLRPSSAAQQL